MTKDVALKLALEALECALSDDRPYIVQCKEAITAIKEALAQPEQEPEHVTYAGNGTAGFLEGERPTGFFIQADRQQPEQEPVAYLCENAVGHKYFRWKKPSSTYKPIALYTKENK